MASVGSVTTTLVAEMAPLRAGLQQGARDIRQFSTTVDRGLAQAAGSGTHHLGQLERAAAGFGLSRASLSASSGPSGGTLVVPLSGLPPSPSPVVMARDAQHQMLWMETARVAQQLGWRVRLA